MVWINHFCRNDWFLFKLHSSINAARRHSIRQIYFPSHLPVQKLLYRLYMYCTDILLVPRSFTDDPVDHITF